MGEAKQRKKNDSNFGRIPPTPSYRGIIVSPPMEIDGSRLTAKSSSLDPQELRFALLFWDRMVWPSSKTIYFESGLDESFLESAGVMTRPDYTIYGDVAQGIATRQIRAFQDCEQSEPGVWTLAQGENSFLLKEGLTEEGKGAYLELHRAIPIPKADVPLAEILEFKQRRHNELVVLRQKIESFVTEIEASADRPLELENRIAEIDKACADLLKVTPEWQFPVFLSNIKASFSLAPQKFLPALAGGWTLGERYGLTAATAVAAFAGLASTLEIKGDYGLRSPKRPLSPYRYTYQIHKELR